MLLKKKLEYIHEFQLEYPNSHVGGSIGLFLHRIDLKRDLDGSDIDMTVDIFDKNCIDKRHLTRKSSGKNKDDFDVSFNAYQSKYKYIKVDLRINPEPTFEIIEYGCTKYNVSKLNDILFWKQRYANSGIQKHINDLIIIKKELELIEKREILYPF
jgi:hypothetical protein